MSVTHMVARGIAAVRAHLRVVLALYVVQLGLGLIFTFAVARTFSSLYAKRPLFSRGVAGDDAALELALVAHEPVLGALLWAGIGLLVGYALASFYLGAGLLGALAGRPFGATAAARFWGFVRLWLWSLLPWALAGIVAFAGLLVDDFAVSDVAAWTTAVVRPLVTLIPALAIAVVTACAVDLARADLVLNGGGSARALGRGLKRALTRPALLAHYALYLLAWGGISAAFVAATFGRDFPGVTGAWLLLFLRQATALARFLARAVASGGQLAAVHGADVAEPQPAPRDAAPLEPAPTAEPVAPEDE